MSDTDRCAAFRDLACCFLCISKMREAPWLNGVCKVTINEWEKQWQKARGFLCIRFLGGILAQRRESRGREHTHTCKHTPRKGVCLPSQHHWQEAITLNVLKCSTAKGEQNQSLCLSWPCLPTGPHHCGRHHTGKRSPLHIQQATLMCKCMQEIFRKAKITEPNEVAALKLLGLWIITARFLELSSFFPPFWQKQWLQWFNWGKSKRGVKLLCFRGSV